MNKVIATIISVLVGLALISHVPGPSPSWTRIGLMFGQLMLPLLILGAAYVKSNTGGMVIFTSLALCLAFSVVAATLIGCGILAGFVLFLIELVVGLTCGVLYDKN